jgi:uncharacterized Zn finger protein (UPF0148 family)
MADIQERVIVRREPLLNKTCPVCGQIFTGLARQLYCSMACNQRASYQRHAEERRATQRKRYRRKRNQRLKEEMDGND